MRCLLYVAAIVGGFAVGFAVMLAVGAVTNDQNLSTAIGVSAWFFTMILTIAYGELWLQKHRPTGKSELKLDAAAFRMAFVFATIGAATSAFANAGDFASAVSIAFCAAVGWFVGRDLKHRSQRILEELATRTDRIEAKF
jgi:hypothetical protein